MTTARKIQGAQAFGVHLDIQGDDLVYDSRYEVSPKILDKIAAHQAEISAILKPRLAARDELLGQVQDFDSEQYTAFKNVRDQEIDTAKAAFGMMEAAAAIVTPIMRTEKKTWRGAVQWLLNHKSFAWYARHRPKGLSDEQWLLACYQAREFGLKAPPVKQRVAS